MNHYYKNLMYCFDRYKKYNIPYYQRRYVWNKPENVRILYKFVDDICDAYKESQESSYFIGSLSFSSHDGIVDVVDGQQRLTSLIMLMSIIANEKCSSEKNAFHKELIYPDGNFVIQEPFYLTAELEGVLGYKPYAGTGYKVKLDETVEKLKNKINRNLSSFSTIEFDSFYDYILNNIYVIGIEYNTVKDALRYFLNINSLSIELKSYEIFYAILSQSLVISHSAVSINYVISQIDKLIEQYSGIKTPDDIIKIFISAYYKGDPNINELESLGIGRWMSYFHVDVFGDAIIAKNFCDSFSDYLEDFETIIKMFAFKDVRLSVKSPIYMSFCLLNYERFDDLIPLLSMVFKYHHNYRDSSLNKDGIKQIDIAKVEELSRRYNLTALWNYIRDNTVRTTGLYDNTEKDSSGSFKLDIPQIIMNINIDDVFVLGYLEKNSFQSDPKINVPDKSRLIKVILALEQAYLSYKAQLSKPMYEYFGELLSGQKFTIEHLYSVKEYSDNTRVSNWRNKGMFSNASEFDMERSKFENLTLLNYSANSSANDDTIYDKLNKYKVASSIFTHEDEYLIQSLVPNSNYYANTNLISLGLPDHTITNINQNTWEHSINNKDFIRKLIELALNEL